DAETQSPIAGASIQSGPREVRTDEEGRFTVASPILPLLVKAPGYGRQTVAAGTSPLTISLRPRAIKAAYLTYFGVGDRGIRTRVFELLDQTELNGVVIDVKGDRGWIPYRTQVPLAREAGAQGPLIIKEFDQMLAELKAKGIYTIARIVVFKDNVLAHYRPDWAVIDTRTGQPWLDNEGLAWVDPFREEVWDYAIAIAQEAARKGFDEIQFDYVRFPTDGKLGLARYSRPNTRQTRLPAIAGFLARARKELGPAGVFLAADVFGYTAFNENDTDIGQRVEELAPYLDYLSPMVYPSGYHLGIPGYRNPVDHPYEVVFESVKHLKKRTATLPIRIRPWIQDFRDYAFDRRPFGVAEVQAQAKGARDAGAAGWMLWNPRNAYTTAALSPKAPANGERSATR
ncbi:MAG: GTP-binding protein, partial [Candidatus Rokubacteria bacterium]|nr:GTP-binding protein [Candidatus Rokubacteria bacterium]